MKKKMIVKVFMGFALAIVCVANVFNTKEIKAKLSDVVLENIDALAIKGQEMEPEWWDYFNNYEVEERIPISTVNCTGSVFTYKGATFSINSCTQYTYAVYHNCYDGGDADMCTSSHVHTYI